MQLIHLSWPVIISVCIGASAAVFANMISLVMIGKINERVPDKDRISYLWWSSEVQKKFRQLYPGNKLTLLLNLCVVMMVVCFILVIRFWVFG